MEKELCELTSMADLILSGETYGYDHALLRMAVSQGFIDPEVTLARESTGDGPDADEARSQFVEKAIAHQKIYDAKLGEAINSASARIKKAQARRKQTISEEFDDYGQKFTTAALGLLTGCMHATTIVDQAIREARGTVDRGMNSQAIRAGTKSFFARLNISNQSRLNGYVSQQLNSLRSGFQDLVDISRSNSPYKNTAAYRAQVHSMKRTADAVSAFRETSSASVRQSEKVLHECNSVLSGINSTRQESLKLAERAVMPVWKKVGIFALIITIHAIMWFIVTKIIVKIVHWYERRQIEK